MTMTDTNTQKIIQIMKHFQFAYGQDNVVHLDREVAEYGKHYTINQKNEIEILPPQSLPAVFLYLRDNSSFTSLPVKFAEYLNLINIFVTDTALTSLAGFPTNIKGSLICMRNENLSLQGAPQTVTRHCNFDFGNLKSLENLPQHSAMYWLEHNNLTSFEGLVSNNSNLHIDVKNNMFSTFDSCPKNVKYLEIALQKVPIISCQGIPESVEHLVIDIHTPLLTLINTDACMQGKLEFIEMKHNMPDAKLASHILDIINQSKTKPLPMMDLAIRLKTAGLIKLAKF